MHQINRPLIPCWPVALLLFFFLNPYCILRILGRLLVECFFFNALGKNIKKDFWALFLKLMFPPRIICHLHPNCVAQFFWDNTCFICILKKLAKSCSFVIYFTFICFEENITNGLKIMPTYQEAFGIFLKDSLPR